MSTVTHYLFTCNKDYNGGRKTKNNVGLPKKKKKGQGRKKLGRMDESLPPYVTCDLILQLILLPMIIVCSIRSLKT